MSNHPRRIARVSNQYLLMLLIAVRRLGCADVSAKLLVEVWQSQGRHVNEIFFLHFDVLIEYGFLIVSEKVGQSVSQSSDSFASLLEPLIALDVQVSISDTGTDFLERYYGQ